MSNRWFIITVDNEEDDQWGKTGNSTENAKYLARFQKLCEKYGFKPVYLTTYHMANNPVFEEMATKAVLEGNCEVGMHLHAWCTPPNYKLASVNSEKSYLIEYPNDVMEQKIKELHELLSSKYGEIITHRAGRWATNDTYFEILKKYGYKCDCSVTPGVSWSSNLGETGIGGTDYLNCSGDVNEIYDGIIEVPMTIKRIRYFDINAVKSPMSFLRECSHLIRGKQTWMRPSISSTHQLKTLVKKMKRSNSKYIMFMIHSSELMPGGSPYYKNEASIEALYKQLDELFELISRTYNGITLKEFIRKGVIKQ